MSFAVNVEQLPNYLLLHVVGAMSAANMKALVVSIRKQCDPTGQTRVLLNCMGKKGMLPLSELFHAGVIFRLPCRECVKS